MVLKVLVLLTVDSDFYIAKTGFYIILFPDYICNTLIQPHFDYGFPSCYPNLNKRLKLKLQKTLREKCPNMEFFLIRIFLYLYSETSAYSPT